MTTQSINLGHLEAISQGFENRTPYLNNGIYVDLKKLADLGYDLTEYLQKYMNWLGLQNEYNINVLRVFYESLTATVKYRDISKKKTAIGRVDFKATVRGRRIKFNWSHINRFLGITDKELNEWTFPERLDQADLELAYGTGGKKVPGMPYT